MKTCLLALLCAFSAMLASCASSGKEFAPGPDDKLNAAESAALTSHARNFIAGNKKLKLSASERDCIKTSAPETLVRYTAPKAGQLSLAWQISPEKRLIILLDGEFLSEGHQAWELQIVRNEETLYIKPAKNDERQLLPEKAD